MTLYRSYQVNEDTPVQFAGVYVLRWRKEWGEPTILFGEIGHDDVALVGIRRAALAEAVECCITFAAESDTIRDEQAAISLARTIRALKS